MSAADAAPWITLLSLIVGFVWQGYRESRQRRWDAEDRKALKETATAALQQGQANGAKADAAVERADQLMSKTDGIVTATNGNLSKMEGLLAVALQKIESMEKAVTVAKQTSDDAVQVALDTPVENGAVNK